MSISSFSADCSRVEVSVSYGTMNIEVSDCKLSESVSATEAVEEFGAAELLDAIGGLGDWIEAGNIDPDQVAEWLQDQGYNVEKPL